MRGGRGPGPPGGFSLVELLFALLIFQIGILGVAGMVLTGQRILNRAHVLMRGALEARRVGDSLMAAGDKLTGERTYPWGRLRWIPAEDGRLQLLVSASNAKDTLAVLWLWPDPGGGSAEPDSSADLSGAHP